MRGDIPTEESLDEKFVGKTGEQVMEGPLTIGTVELTTNQDIVTLRHYSEDVPYRVTVRGVASPSDSTDAVNREYFDNNIQRISVTYGIAEVTEDRSVILDAIDSEVSSLYSIIPNSAGTVYVEYTGTKGVVIVVHNGSTFELVAKSVEYEKDNHRYIFRVATDLPYHAFIDSIYMGILIR